MRLRVTPRLYKLRQIHLTRLESSIRQLAAKKLVSQPELIGVHDIGFAILRNVSDATLAIISLNVLATNAVRLSGQSHHPAHLMQRCFSLRVEEDSTSQRSIASSV